MARRNLLLLPHERVKVLVLKVLRRTHRERTRVRSVAKDHLLKLVVRELGATPPQRQARIEFQKKVNLAVGALKREGRIEEKWATNWWRLYFLG